MSIVIAARQTCLDVFISMTLLRPLPADVPALGPHQTLSPRKDRHRGVSGAHLDGTSPG